MVVQHEGVVGNQRQAGLKRLGRRFISSHCVQEAAFGGAKARFQRLVDARKRCTPLDPLETLVEFADFLRCEDPQQVEFRIEREALQSLHRQFVHARITSDFGAKCHRIPPNFSRPRIHFQSPFQCFHGFGEVAVRVSVVRPELVEDDLVGVGTDRAANEVARRGVPLVA